MQIYTYPDSEYTLCHDLQLAVNDKVDADSRRIKKIAVVLGIIAMLGVISNLLAIPSLSRILWSTFGLSFAGGMIYVVLKPKKRHRCPSCSTKMKFQWKGNAQFLVCHSCKCYVYTHQSGAD
jgi:hypothetical protein